MLYINLGVTVSLRQLSVENLKGNDITLPIAKKYYSLS